MEYKRPIKQINKCVSVHSAVLTLCDPMDCSPSGSSAHGIFQARILEWVSFPSPGVNKYSGINLAKSSLLSRLLTVESTNKYKSRIYK